MHTPGDRDEFAEAVAARALLPKGGQLGILRDELWRASQDFSKGGYILAITVAGTLPFLITIELNSGYPHSAVAIAIVPLLARLCGYALVAILLGLAWLAHLRRVRQLRRELPERIRQSGLVERIALGPGELPDIHAFTLWPWSLLLGPRPVSFKGYARLIAMNPDWYLLPAPRPLFRIAWVHSVFLALFIPFTLWRMFSSAMQVVVPPVALFPGAAKWLVYAGILLLYVFALLFNRERHYLSCCAGALYTEVNQRLQE